MTHSRSAIRHFSGSNHSTWIWRCHIDSSSPDPEVWEFVRQFVKQYDAAVFTMESFEPSDLGDSSRFIPPAIDPLSTKDLELSEELYCRVLSELGVSLRQPTFTSFTF